MMRPGVAISALALTLSVIQPGHAAVPYAGAAVKADIQAVTGNHIVKVRERHRLRSRRSFGHRRHGRHGRSFRHGRRRGFRHGRRHGNTKFLLGLAFPFAYFAYGPYVRYRHYGGQGFYYGGYKYGPGVIGGYSYGGPGSYGLGPGRTRYSAGCRAVSKIDHDRFGRWAKFGGTMCYDRYGNPYILSHSRHVIHYY